MRLPKFTVEAALTAVGVLLAASALSGCVRMRSDQSATSGGVWELETVSPFGRGCDGFQPSSPAEPPEGGTLEDGGG